MHPIVSLGLVTAVIVCLAAGGWREILVVGGACAALLPRARGLSTAVLVQTLWRLRLFYLSLVILYAWFSPGDPLFPALGALSPSLSGLATAGRYIAMLVVIVTLVQLLMACCRREELVAALRWWLRPCRFLGLDPDRVALRLMLVAQVLPRLRELASNVSGAQQQGRGVSALVSRASSVFERTLDEAERATPPSLAVPRLPPPSTREWVAALAVVVLLSLV